MLGPKECPQGGFPRLVTQGGSHKRCPPRGVPQGGSANGCPSRGNRKEGPTTGHTRGFPKVFRKIGLPRQSFKEGPQWGSARIP
jgi:hypothetical protein